MKMAESKADGSLGLTLPESQIPERWIIRTYGLVLVVAIKLTVGDRETLESDIWLCDSVINTAQQLLHKQYPYIGGVQDPTLPEQIH